VIAGTDSHTCMGGALGAFAFGVGSTDMANAWFTRDVRVKVPETVRFVLTGALRTGVSAKDVMLHILSQPFFSAPAAASARCSSSRCGPRHHCRWTSRPRSPTWRSRRAASPASSSRARASSTTCTRCVAHRRRRIEKRIVRSDPDAQYLDTFEIDLSAVPVMLATPGDPRNGIAMQDVQG